MGSCQGHAEVSSESTRPLYTVRGEVYGRVMDTKLTTSFLWSARLIGVAILSFLLALGPLSIAYAEEDSGEPVAEEDSGEPVAEEPAAEEPAPQPEPEAPAGGYVLDGEVISPDNHGYVPPPEAFEGLGGWAEVDPVTGEIFTVVVGNVTSMKDWEHQKSAMARSSNGRVMRFQTRATPDGNVAGYGAGSGARFDASSGNFNISGGSGDTTTSQTLVPSRTSRDANGEGRTYNIGSGLIDIETSTTKRSGDTSATLRTYRSDYQDPTLDATVDLPDVGERGSRLFYELEVRTSESSERPSALDQISLDVDSILMEEGFATTDITVDEETGEESSTEVVDSSNVFVSAVREATGAVVDFLSRLLGFGDPRS